MTTWEIIKLILKLPKKLRDVLIQFVKLYWSVKMNTERIIKIKAVIRAVAIILSLFAINLDEEVVDAIAIAVDALWAVGEIILGYTQAHKMKVDKN